MTTYFVTWSSFLTKAGTDESTVSTGTSPIYDTKSTAQQIFQEKVSSLRQGLSHLDQEIQYTICWTPKRNNRSHWAVLKTSAEIEKFTHWSTAYSVQAEIQTDQETRVIIIESKSRELVLN